MIRDKLFQDDTYQVPQFVFDQAVADVFEDMIKRSVPGYSTVLDILGVIAKVYTQPKTHIYDLGCSQGAATAVLGTSIQAENCKIIAVDNAPAMIEKCHTNLAKLNIKPNLEIHCQDICETQIQNASLVVLNLTLQFIPIEKRLPLLKKIRSGMNPNGALVLFEKIKSSIPDEQTFITTLHHQFKKANGYSELEISRKRNALENVLITETHEAYLQRLQQAGFKDVYHWFSCLNFNAYIAFSR